MPSLRRRALPVLPLALLGRPVRAQPVRRLFALIVGIDSYPNIRALRGCVNDARLLDSVIRPVADRTTLLLEAEATRGAFLRAWDAMAAEARAGDTLLITFAGHGGQERERVRGNERDGLDETLIFHAFHPRWQPNNAERIIDDELGDRFARSGARGIRSIFLADSCHAGTLTRGIDSRAEGLGHRSAGLQNIENDMLAGLDLPAAEPAGQPNLLFVAAGQENQLVPEMMIDGRPHGAASHAFATAFRRAAEAGAFPSSDVFAREVVAATRSRAEGRHHPLAENRLPPAEPLLTLARRAPAQAAADAGPVRLHILPGGGALAEAAGRLPGVRLVPQRQGADAVLDPRGDLVSGLGDVLAVRLDAGALPGAIEKLAALRLMQARRLPAMEVGLVPRGASLAPGGANSRDERHREGSEWDLVVRPPRPSALVVIALSADGRMRVISSAEGAAGATGAEFRFGVRVTPPAGAAHVVAVAAGGSLAALRTALMRLDRQHAPMAAVQAMASVPDATAVALFGFFVE